MITINQAGFTILALALPKVIYNIYKATKKIFKKSTAYFQAQYPRPNINLKDFNMAELQTHLKEIEGGKHPQVNEMAAKCLRANRFREQPSY